MASSIQRESEEETIRNRGFTKEEGRDRRKSFKPRAIFLFEKRFAFLYENGIESRLVWL